jgi:hypothetical protein
MRKLIFPALAVSIAAICVSCGSTPAAVLGGGDFLYSANQYNGITILRYNGSKKNIIIPENINALPVNVIGRSAFSGKGITEAELPETIFRIDDNAFANNKLRSIELPEGLKFIGDGAFKNNRLESVNLSEGITEIGSAAFENNRIASLKLPLSLKTAGDYCFASNRVKSVELSESLFAVPVGMLARNNIVVLRLPDTVRLIGVEAFADNPIEALSFWGGEYVGKNAFARTKLKVIGIAENVRFDSKSEMGPGFQNAYKSMGGAAGMYYERADKVWWVKEE